MYTSQLLIPTTDKILPSTQYVYATNNVIRFQRLSVNSTEADCETPKATKVNGPPTDYTTSLNCRQYHQFGHALGCGGWEKTM